MINEPNVRPKDFWYDTVGKIRIMAVGDGYAMCRRPHCMPFVEDIKTIKRDWVHQDNLEVQQP